MPRLSTLPLHEVLHCPEDEHLGLIEVTSQFVSPTWLSIHYQRNGKVK